MTKIIFSYKLEFSSNTLYVKNSTLSEILLEYFNANTLELIELISKFVKNGKSIE